MAVQSTVPAFLAAFRTSLGARAGLSTVGIDLVMTGDTSRRERIILITGPIAGGQARFAMNRRQDSYRIPGQLEAFAADPDTDVAFQAAFTRAGAILDELVQELDDNRPQVGDGTLDATVSDITYLPQIPEGGGWSCVCTFVVEYSTVVT
jgi:hypothetical protein